MAAQIEPFQRRVRQMLIELDALSFTIRVFQPDFLVTLRSAQTISSNCAGSSIEYVTGRDTTLQRTLVNMRLSLFG